MTPDELRTQFLAGLPAVAEPHREAIAAAAHGVLAGWKTDAVTGRSKIGGRPDLPADLEWPLHRGEKPEYGFLMQIDFAEVNPDGASSRLPSKGILYVFALCDRVNSQYYIMDGGTSAVRFVPDPGELAPRDHPDGLPASARVPEAGLRFGPSVILDEAVEPDEDDLAAAEDDEDDAWQAKIWHRRKSFAAATQDQLDDLLVRLGSGRPQFTFDKTPWFWQDEAMMAYEDGGVDLLSFRGNLVSDEYRGCDLHWVIDEKALLAGDLGRAWLIFEGGHS